MSTLELHRAIARKYLVAATSILLATTIGTSSAFAEESKKGTEKPTETKAAAVPDNAEWNPYLEELEKQILGKWFPPSDSGYKAVTIEMRIRKDGRLSTTNITKSSQIKVIDEAAQKAVNDAAPFKPFPDNVKPEEFAKFEINFDKSDISLNRRIVRKLDKFSKREKQNNDTKQSF